MFLRFQKIKSLCTVEFGRGCRGEELERLSEDIPSGEVATSRPLYTASLEVWLYNNSNNNKYRVADLLLNCLCAHFVCISLCYLV